MPTSYTPNGEENGVVKDFTFRHWSVSRTPTFYSRRPEGETDDERLDRLLAYQALVALNTFTSRREAEEAGYLRPMTGAEAVRTLQRSLSLCRLELPAERKRNLVSGTLRPVPGAKTGSCDLLLRDGQVDRLRRMYQQTSHYHADLMARGRETVASARNALRERRMDREQQTDKLDDGMEDLLRAMSGEYDEETEEEEEELIQNQQGTEWYRKQQEQDMLDSLTPGAFKDPDVEPSSDEEEDVVQQTVIRKGVKREPEEDLFCYEDISPVPIKRGKGNSDDPYLLDTDTETEEDEGVERDDEDDKMMCLLVDCKEEEKAARRNLSDCSRRLWKAMRDTEHKDLITLLEFEVARAKRRYADATDKTLHAQAVAEVQKERRDYDAMQELAVAREPIRLSVIQYAPPCKKAKKDANCGRWKSRKEKAKAFPL